MIHDGDVMVCGVGWVGGSKLCGYSVTQTCLSDKLSQGSAPPSTFCRGQGCRRDGPTIIIHHRLVGPESICAPLILQESCSSSQPLKAELGMVLAAIKYPAGAAERAGQHQPISSETRPKSRHVVCARPVTFRLCQGGRQRRRRPGTSV